MKQETAAQIAPVKTPEKDGQQIHWLRMLRDQHWTRRQKFALLELLGSPGEVYVRGYQACAQLLRTEVKLSHSEPPPESLVSDQAWLNAEHQHLITFWDESYPELLRQISDPPLALFAKGDLQLLNDPKVAIVGSRRPSPAGAKMANRFAQGLARLGVVITSGMALGVDGLAHHAALDSEGSTIAVLGCGLDIIYPARHRSLYEGIAANGLLISEYPLGFEATRYSFPQRNRIVSGLCLGTIIIEAAERSGTCITARLTGEQNRELMVLPGSPLNPQYAGSNALIRDGAALVSTVEDVLQVVSIPLQSALCQLTESDTEYAESLQSPAQDNRQNVLLPHIDFDSTPVDRIILGSGLTAAEVSSMLLMLELEGVIAATEDGGYVRLS